MTKQEFVDLWDKEVKGRWPKYEASPLDMADWYTAIGHCKPIDISNAIQKHRISDDPARPNLSRVKEFLAVVATKKHFEPVPTPGPDGLIGQDAKLQAFRNIASRTDEEGGKLRKFCARFSREYCQIDKDVVDLCRSTGVPVALDHSITEGPQKVGQVLSL
jgi:hypothetical protein